MEQFLIDNNVISNFFAGLFRSDGLKFVAEIIDGIPNISVITQIEALSWVNSDKTKEAIIKEFIGDAVIFNLSEEVISICVQIKRSRKMKFPDAVIAATAIAHNLTLVTSDQGFKNIPDLRVIDPFIL